MKRAAGIAVLTLSAALAWGPAVTAPVAAQGSASSVQLAPHRAVYDLQLATTRGKRALQSVRGRILYDFSGSACEGYALQFRQVSELDTGEGRVMVSDLRAATWEEGQGGRLTFHSENYLDDSLRDAVNGEARRGDDGVAVRLSKPASKSFDLGRDLVFPTQHVRRVLEAAKEGRTILQVAVYDGSESGEKVYDTMTVIGGRIEPEAKVPDDAAGKEPALSGLSRWPVTVSYFERGKPGGEQTPVYAINFEMYENGVSRGLMLDYNDFVVAGTMSSIELKDAKPCP